MEILTVMSMVISTGLVATLVAAYVSILFQKSYVRWYDNHYDKLPSWEKREDWVVSGTGYALSGSIIHIKEQSRMYQRKALIVVGVFVAAAIIITQTIGWAAYSNI